jgi:hypothetical protein
LVLFLCFSFFKNTNYSYLLPAVAAVASTNPGAAHPGPIGAADPVASLTTFILPAAAVIACTNPGSGLTVSPAAVVACRNPGPVRAADPFASLTTSANGAFFLLFIFQK